MSEPKNLAEALIKFHESVPTIHQNAESFHGMFANMAGVLSTIGPALRSCGLAVSQVPAQVDGKPGLRTTLLHVSGEQITDTSPLCIQEGVDRKGKPLNVTQEWGKAVTYTRRYALQSVLGICVGIEDNDADAAPETQNSVKPAPTPKQEHKSTAKAELAELGDRAPADQTDVKEILAVLAAWMESDKKEDTELFQRFCKSFRSHKGLRSNAKIRENLLTIADTKWAQEFINSPPAA